MAATRSDEFIQAQITGILRPGETVQHTAFVTRAPGLLMQALLLGALLAFILTKAYFLVVTNQRVLLIRTSFGMFGPGHVNRGIEEFALASIKQVKVGGLLGNRSLTFIDAQGRKDTIRINPFTKSVTGQKAFFQQFPEQVNAAKQLAA